MPGFSQTQEIKLPSVAQQEVNAQEFSCYIQHQLKTLKVLQTGEN